MTTIPDFLLSKHLHNTTQEFLLRCLCWFGSGLNSGQNLINAEKITSLEDEAYLLTCQHGVIETLRMMIENRKLTQSIDPEVVEINITQ